MHSNMTPYTYQYMIPGTLYYYPGYTARDQTKFQSELKHSLTRAIGFEAVMRVRATRGMSMCILFTYYALLSSLFSYTSAYSRIAIHHTPYTIHQIPYTIIGIRFSNFYGNYYVRGTDLLALPNVTPESCFALDMAYDEAMLGAQVCNIQQIPYIYH
ncbi:hypothetical protein EON63_19110 [archaeon]|nr:MAG: hypothetical protein EON63_19110 [archaeon]